MKATRKQRQAQRSKTKLNLMEQCERVQEHAVGNAEGADRFNMPRMPHWKDMHDVASELLRRLENEQ